MTTTHSPDDEKNAYLADQNMKRKKLAESLGMTLEEFDDMTEQYERKLAKKGYIVRTTGDKYLTEEEKLFKSIAESLGMTSPEFKEYIDAKQIEIRAKRSE